FLGDRESVRHFALIIILCLGMFSVDASAGRRRREMRAQYRMQTQLTWRQFRRMYRHQRRMGRFAPPVTPVTPIADEGYNEPNQPSADDLKIPPMPNHDSSPTPDTIEPDRRQTVE